MSNLRSLREAKEDFDWVDYLELNYATKIVEGKNGREYRICCPMCGEDKFKCYVNPSKHAFYCFKCPFRTNNNYDLFDLVSITEGITKGAAIIKVLQETKPVAPTLEDLEDKVRDDDNEVLLSPLNFIKGMPKEAVPVTAEDGDPQWLHLKSRGFNERDLLLTNAHKIPDAKLALLDSKGIYRGDLGQRVLFPVYGPDGRMVSWLARSTTGSEPKYLNCPETDLSKTLWPYVKPQGDTVVVVEGIIDALSIYKHTGRSVYATFGKSMSEQQISLLNSWGVKNIIIWYDKKDAKREMVSLVARTQLRFSNVFVLDLADWPADKDAGDYLAGDNGVLESTIRRTINTYDSLAFAKWCRTP